MIKTSLRIAFRNILKNKWLNGINIIGLSIGMMAVLLIYQYIRFENSYDKHLDNADRLHRLVFYRYYQTGLDKSVGNNYYVGQLAFEKIPFIENFCRCRKETGFFQVGEKIFKEEKTFFADSSFFDLFSYNVKAGLKSEFLRGPNVAIITESLAKKYFGNDNPVGKTIYTINPGQRAITIQGVVKDMPENSHLKFDIIISLETLLGKNYCYTCNNTNTYFLLQKGANPAIVAKKITAIAEDYFKSRDIKINFPIEYRLQPVTDIHLFSDFRFEHAANGNNKYQSILVVIALFILISAALNYFNLYVSVTERRISGIGTRIVAGASKKHIISEFTVEAVITGLISLVLAFILLYLLFPLFKNYLNFNFSLDSLNPAQAWLLPCSVFLLLSFFTGILLGIKFFRTTPIAIVKKNLTNSSKKYAHKLLLTAQFVIAIFLTAGTITVMKQIQYMQKDAFSMHIDQTLVVKVPFTKNFNQTQLSFRESLKQNPDISDVTFSTITPGEKNQWVKGGIYITGKESATDRQIFQSDVAPNFFNFFWVKLLAGRQFFSDESNWNDADRHVIINKEAALALSSGNLEDVIGKSLYDPDDKLNIGEIVGIVDGYFQNSLDQEVLPTIFNCDQLGSFIFIKISQANIKKTLEKIKADFQHHYKGQYWDYYFLDEYFNNQYKLHIQFNRNVILFSIMAIIIACLSLLGTSVMVSIFRTKEIGIRKVNGAKTYEILIMLNAGLLKWVIVAFIIACPIAWYTMKLWLQNFAYKMELSWTIYVVAGLLALFVAFITVSWQSYRAATRNPVESLKYE
jgi:putative ABC transport system permease protein